MLTDNLHIGNTTHAFYKIQEKQKHYLIDNYIPQSMESFVHLLSLNPLLLLLTPSSCIRTVNMVSSFVCISMLVYNTSDVFINLPVLLVVNVGVYCFQVSSYTKLMALTVSITVTNCQTKPHFVYNCTNVPYIILSKY